MVLHHVHVPLGLLTNCQARLLILKELLTLAVPYQAKLTNKQDRLSNLAICTVPNVLSKNLLLWGVLTEVKDKIHLILPTCYTNLEQSEHSQ